MLLSLLVKVQRLAGLDKSHVLSAKVLAFARGSAFRTGICLSPEDFDLAERGSLSESPDSVVFPLSDPIILDAAVSLSLVAVFLSLVTAPAAFVNGVPRGTESAAWLVTCCLRAPIVADATLLSGSSSSSELDDDSLAFRDAAFVNDVPRGTESATLLANCRLRTRTIADARLLSGFSSELNDDSFAFSETELACILRFDNIRHGRLLYVSSSAVSSPVLSWSDLVTGFFSTTVCCLP